MGLHMGSLPRAHNNNIINYYIDEIILLFVRVVHACVLLQTYSKIYFRLSLESSPFSHAVEYRAVLSITVSPSVLP